MPEPPVPQFPHFPYADDSKPPLSDEQLHALGADFLIGGPMLEPDPIEPLTHDYPGQPSFEEFFGHPNPLLPGPGSTDGEALNLEPAAGEVINPPLPKPPSRSRRRRGGQPGNLNALKHGLYIDGYRLKNTTPLERAQLFDLNGMIENIKSYMQFTYDYGVRSKNMAEINETMRSLSLAAMSLTRLIGVHNEYISTPLPPDMKVTRRTDVISLVEHMRKKLEPIVDLSDLDTRDAPEA